MIFLPTNVHTVDVVKVAAAVQDMTRDGRWPNRQTALRDLTTVANSHRDRRLQEALGAYEFHQPETVLA